MDKKKGKAKGPSREQLVEHLVRCMEQQGLTIEAADAPGYRKPGHIKPGLRRSRLRPDVVARDGRRTIFGVAKSEAEASEARLPDQLATFAGKCRMLVICIPKEAADQAVDAVFHNVDTQVSRKMRLLRHPETNWQELPRRSQATRPATFDPRVVVVERD